MSRTAKTLLALFVLLLATGLVAQRTRSRLSDPEHQVERKGGLRDFHNAVYYPAVAVREGVNPYDSDAYRAHYPVRHFPLYSPVTLALYFPLGMLPRGIAEVLYFAAGIAMSVALAWLALHAYGARAPAWRLLALAAVILVSRPGQQNMMNGQSTLQVVIGVVLALRYGSERPWVGALGVVLGTLKPTFGLPLVLLMAARGQFAALARGLAVALAIAVLVLGYLTLQGGGVEALVDSFSRNLARHGDHPNTNLETTYSRIDTVFLVSRWTGWIPALKAQFVIAFGLLAVAAWTVYGLRSRGGPEHGPNTLSDVTCYLAILSFLYHQSYDLLFLAVPLVALIASGSGTWGRPGPASNVTISGPRVRALLALAWLAPLFNFAATASGVRVLGTGPESRVLLWRAVTSLNAVLVLCTFAVCVLLARRATPPAAL
ncbi:MAG: DUF2029 domain-containing protein [bacterium]|nr:DUF2029 domain-containing protein [bacterium]